MSPVFGQNILHFVSHSEAQTRRLGVRLAHLLRPGDVLALVGELGTAGASGLHSSIINPIVDSKESTVEALTLKEDLPSVKDARLMP